MTDICENVLSRLRTMARVSDSQEIRSLASITGELAALVSIAFARMEHKLDEERLDEVDLFRGADAAAGAPEPAGESLHQDDSPPPCGQRESNLAPDPVVEPVLSSGEPEVACAPPPPEVACAPPPEQCSAIVEPEQAATRCCDELIAELKTQIVLEAQKKTTAREGDRRRGRRRL